MYTKSATRASRRTPQQRWLSSHPKAASLGYTLRVEGHFDEAKAQALRPKDVVTLFGAFEPYNIVMRPPGAVGGGAKYQAKKGNSLPPPPLVLATFQVPSLKYAREIAHSFHHDESWGDRITVHQEQETFPVFISGLPEGVSGSELKKQIDRAGASDPKQRRVMGGSEPASESKGQSKSLLTETAIDAYDTYAVFRCPDKYSSMGLLQGSFQLAPVGPKARGNTGEKRLGAGAENGAGATEAEAQAEGNAGERMVEVEEAGQEGRGEGDGEDARGVLSYAAWKTYPVRVNGLPGDANEGEVMAVFSKYMPYDVEVLPVEASEAADGNEGGTRGAYLRFARRIQGVECASEMQDVSVRNNVLQVRRAWEKVYPLLIEAASGEGKVTADELEQVLAPLKRMKDSSLLDAELLEEGAAAVIRFGSQTGAEEGLGVLEAGAGSGRRKVRPAWKDFRVDVRNLPLEVTQEELREMVHLTTPSKVAVSLPVGGRYRTGSLSFTTREEADLAFSQLSGTGLPDLKLRKAWAVYRLRVKGLPADTREEDLREVLRGGYEPFQVDFPRSRKGNPKGEAVLRFRTYDQLVAAIGRLYGRDSPMDEVENQARWASAGEGMSFDDPAGSLEEELARLPPSASSPLSTETGMGLDALFDRHWKEERGPGEEGGGEAGMEGGEAAASKPGGLGVAEPGAKGSGKDVQEEEEEKEEESYAGRDVNPFAIHPEGKWVKMLVDTDTTQKIIKGGHILSYRALVLVGNLKGCGGWGVGKGATLEEAQIRAYRAAKKNLIHIDLYRNRCITTDLYGKHNNCRIYIQAGQPNRPHKEGRMINDMLRIMGVECGEARSIGRRNPYSVVRALFHAISKHEGVEALSRKRGRRLISVSKARYLGL